MSIIKTAYLFFILFTIGVFTLILSQEVRGENSLDKHVFLSCETQGNIETKLSEGYQAFIILPDAPIGELLDNAYDFLSLNNDTLLIFIFKQQRADLHKLLTEHKIKEYLANPESNQLNELDDCITKGKRMFVFAPGNTSLCYSTEDALCDYTVNKEFPLNISTGFSGNPGNDLTIFRMDSSLHFLPDSLKEMVDSIPRFFNTYTGKLPNFFITDHIDSFRSFKNYFDQHNWYCANVLYDNKPLAGVEWEEMPELTSNGKIHVRQDKITPQKKGYRFSPDVFKFDHTAPTHTKIYYASQMHISNKMVLSLKFEGNTNNEVGETKASYSNIRYAKDDSMGWCGVFNGKKHFVDFDTGIELADNIGISVWVNPIKTSGNNSIVGKGEAFSVKIRGGRLLFTIPGIQDLFLDSMVVRKNEWQHLAFVFSANKGVRFFKNGLFIGQKESLDFIPSNQSLLVGTNLWGQSFEGLMDDLIVWDRALSDEEILNVYEQKFEGDDALSPKLIILYISLLLIIILLVIRYLIPSSKRKTSKTKQKSSSVNKHIPIPPKEIDCRNLPILTLFGGFHFENRDNEDLTARFSTRRKQIFILILIYTLKEDGISSKLLTNKIWAGYSAESAKNNRSTQIQRLKEILSQNSGISIDFKYKKWMICFQEDVYCDLKQYFILLNHFKESKLGTLNIQLLEQLLSIIEKGAILPHMDDEWLDEFKSKISDELLDHLVPLFRNKELISNHRLVVRICDALFIFDPLNEIVLEQKINKLFLLEKKTLAHECYEHFCKNYQQSYNQPFAITFGEILNK